MSHDSGLPRMVPDFVLQSNVDGVLDITLTPNHACTGTSSHVLHEAFRYPVINGFGGG